MIMGGFEVKADDADHQWIPHSHLLITGCGEAQLDSLCQQFTAKRASHRVPVTELAKQMSYTQKFLSLLNPTAIRTGPTGRLSIADTRAQRVPGLDRAVPAERTAVPVQFGPPKWARTARQRRAAQPARVAMRRLG